MPSSAAAELGLYRTPAEQMSALASELWRAARLVVDTGMHAFGWTREQATLYLQKSTGRSGAGVMNEIDRYIVWPGQALAYKAGQLEILRIRAAAENRLGEHFDLRSFHDQLLAHGGIPLPVAERVIQDWAAKVEKTVATSP